MAATVMVKNDETGETKRLYTVDARAMLAVEGCTWRLLYDTDVLPPARTGLSTAPPSEASSTPAAEDSVAEASRAENEEAVVESGGGGRRRGRPRA